MTNFWDTLEVSAWASSLSYEDYLERRSFEFGIGRVLSPEVYSGLFKLLDQEMTIAFGGEKND